MTATDNIEARIEIVRLYIYSSTSCTLTRTYWLRAWYALIGVVIGTILFFGIYAFDYFIVSAQGNRTLYDLRAENAVLQRHIHQAASRVAAIDVQEQYLHDRNFALRATVLQSDIAEQRLFTLINPITTPDSLLPGTDALNGGRQHISLIE